MYDLINEFCGMNLQSGLVCVDVLNVLTTGKQNLLVIRSPFMSPLRH